MIDEDSAPPVFRQAVRKAKANQPQKSIDGRYNGIIVVAVLNILVNNGDVVFIAWHGAPDTPNVSRGRVFSPGYLLDQMTAEIQPAVAMRHTRERRDWFHNWFHDWIHGLGWCHVRVCGRHLRLEVFVRKGIEVVEGIVLGNRVDVD